MAKKTDWKKAFWAMANKCGIYSTPPKKKSKKRRTAKKTAAKSTRKKNTHKKSVTKDLFDDFI